MDDPRTLQLLLLVAAIAFIVLFTQYRAAQEERSRAQQHLQSTQVRVQALAQEQYQRWPAADIGALREQLEEAATAQANANLQAWVAQAETSIRRDATQRSQAVTLGKVTEHLAPYFGSFEFNPKDARFIGTPIDLIVFDGLNDDAVREVVFIEIKTGGSKLTSRERMVRQAVLEGRVAWREMRLDDL